MANRTLAKCVGNIVFKLIPRIDPSRVVLLPAVSKNFGCFARSYSRSSGTCNFSEQELKCNRTNRIKNSNVTERILRFLKANPEKVIEKLKKELNTVPSALKIGTGLYDVRPFKCTIRKSSSLFRFTAQNTNTKLSAKGIRHQFNFPEKEPYILDLIKQDLIRIKNDGRRTRNKAGCDL